VAMIQITWSEGRPVEQKQALYKEIADGLLATPGIWPTDVFINLAEVKKGNWFFGNRVAQYAPEGSKGASECSPLPYGLLSKGRNSTRCSCRCACRHRPSCCSLTQTSSRYRCPRSRIPCG
jgi:phenylpyruvate tautomerase PptA (4-oxalocrotonate tautomerase family)